MLGGAYFYATSSDSPQILVSRFLVAGDNGSLYLFSGRALSQIPTPTRADLTHVGWRHDGSYALITMTKNVLLKYDGTSLSEVETGLPPNVWLYSVTWKPDDSEALISGSNGTILSFNGHDFTRVPVAFNGTIRAAEWNPAGQRALLVGDDGFVADYNGTGLKIIPSPTNNTLFTVDWNPTGAYALIGGAWATLLRFQDDRVFSIFTLFLFGYNAHDAHWISDISFNNQTGYALIVGHKGLTILYLDGSLQRTRDYINMTGQDDDLHHIGHFYGVSWIPRTSFAYAVGEDGSVALIRLVSNTRGLVPHTYYSVTVREIFRGNPETSFKSIASF